MAKIQGELYPIKINDYSKYIIIRNSLEEFILKMLNEYGESYGGPKKLYEFKYYVLSKPNNEKWIIMKCPDDLTFYDFHNLTQWLRGYGEMNGCPDLTAAIAIHNIDNLESYYATLDINNACGDTFNGVFDDGNEFSIYLPEGYIEGGNIKIKYNSLKNIGVFNYLNSLGLNYDDLKSFDHKTYKTVKVQMSAE